MKILSFKSILLLQIRSKVHKWKTQWAEMQENDIGLNDAQISQ